MREIELNHVSLCENVNNCLTLANGVYWKMPSTCRSMISDSNSYNTLVVCMCETPLPLGLYII